MNDASPGSLGLWTTIVHPPAIEQEARAAPQPAADNKTAKAQENQNSSLERRRASRSPGLIEQSNKRNSARPRIQTASVNRGFNDDFWERMSMDGN